MQTIECLVCNQSFLGYERYPRMVCSECFEKTVDSKGKRVVFRNGMNGFGFESHHYDKKGNVTIKSDHICYIDNKKCYADEARMGGIVIELL
jgi:hypothetical protein